MLSSFATSVHAHRTAKTVPRVAFIAKLSFCTLETSFLPDLDLEYIYQHEPRRSTTSHSRPRGGHVVQQLSFAVMLLTNGSHCNQMTCDQGSLASYGSAVILRSTSNIKVYEKARSKVHCSSATEIAISACQRQTTSSAEEEYHSTVRTLVSL